MGKYSGYLLHIRDAKWFTLESAKRNKLWLIMLRRVRKQSLIYNIMSFDCVEWASIRHVRPSCGMVSDTRHKYNAIEYAVLAKRSMKFMTSSTIWHSPDTSLRLLHWCSSKECTVTRYWDMDYWLIWLHKEQYWIVIYSMLVAILPMPCWGAVSNHTAPLA